MGWRSPACICGVDRSAVRTQRLDAAGVGDGSLKWRCQRWRPIFSSSATVTAIVHLPNGVRIEASPHIDTGWLSQLMRIASAMGRGG